METTQPKVTVLMPVFNGEKYVRAAMDSILCQTYTDFEFIVVDNGSTDLTHKTVTSYSDNRIRIIRHSVNLGVSCALNTGLAVARGDYIARMDADDISTPERLATQVEFLDANPDIHVLGGQVTLIDAAGNTINRQHRYFPTEPGIIRWTLFFRDCIADPTTMIRKSVYDHFGGYDVEYRRSQDYEMWMRINLHVRMANIPHVLLARRLHEEQLTKILRKSRSRIAKQRLWSEALARQVSMDFFQALEWRNRALTPERLVEAATALRDLYHFCVGSMPSREDMGIAQETIRRLGDLAADYLPRHPDKDLARLILDCMWSVSGGRWTWIALPLAKSVYYRSGSAINSGLRAIKAKRLAKPGPR